MNDKITELYKLLNESKDFSGVFQTEDEVRSVIDDPAKVQDFYNLINESEDFKGVFKDVNEFTNTFQVKKKRRFYTKFIGKCLVCSKKYVSWQQGIANTIRRIWNSTTTINI